MIKIIGLSAKKQHGKDYFTGFLKKADPSITQYGFSYPLKEMCARIFPVAENLFHCPVGKEVKLTIPIELDNYVAKLQSETGLVIPLRGLLAHSPREILQYIGTDYVRSVKDDFWICKFLERLSTLSGTLVVSDVRFPNEGIALKSFGGELVHLVRKKLEKESCGETHISELGVAKMQDMGLFDKVREVEEGEDLTEFAKEVLGGG